MAAGQQSELVLCWSVSPRTHRSENRRAGASEGRLHPVPSQQHISTAERLQKPGCPGPLSTSDVSVGETRARALLKAVPQAQRPARAAMDSPWGTQAGGTPSWPHPERPTGPGLQVLSWVLPSSFLHLRFSP